MIVVLTAFILIAATKSDDDYFEISKNLRIMSSVYEKLNGFYVDEVLPWKSHENRYKRDVKIIRSIYCLYFRI